MAEKYLDLSGLTTYDGKIKAHINSVASNKADKTHSHTVSDITDLTVDATELNYMDGTTSNVQAQLDSKLSLSGGTMTGEITLAQNTLAKRDVDTSGLIIHGGTEFSNSASVAVYGKDQANYSGRFRLTADNGEETCTLEGRPNGVLKWDGQNVLTNDDKTEIQTQLDNKVSKFGSTMTGNLEICNNMEQSPMLTISGTANESGVRASSYIIKVANSISNGGTEIVDEGFDTTSTSLVVNNNAGLSGSLKLTKMNSDYSIANYFIYGEHNKPTPEDIGAVSKADQRWNLIYDSGEISAIANSISNIDVSGYTNIQVLVRIYNDGDSINSRAGSAIFTCENGKTYQFPVWSNMFSKSINTVYTMATFNLVDGWLICPCASRLIGDATTFEDEGGTAGSLSPTGSGMMKCTSSLSTLTISNLDQNSNYYFGMGSRVMVWGWNA